MILKIQIKGWVRIKGSDWSWPWTLPGISSSSSQRKQKSVLIISSTNDDGSNPCKTQTKGDSKCKSKLQNGNYSCRRKILSNWARWIEALLKCSSSFSGFHSPQFDFPIYFSISSPCTAPCSAKSCSCCTGLKCRSGVGRHIWEKKAAICILPL